MARNYAALPHEYIEEFAEFTYEEIGRLVCALLHYSATGEEKKPEGNERFLWKRVVAQEDRFQESYDSILESRREAGRKGAEKRWQNGRATDANSKNGKAMDANGKTDYTETETETNTNTETDTYTDRETDTYTHVSPSIDGRDRALMPFSPPSAEEVKAYCRENGFRTDGEQFTDFYAARGWTIGQSPMRDWRAALRNWERREQNSPQAQREREEAKKRQREIEANERAMQNLERLLAQQSAGYA